MPLTCTHCSRVNSTDARYCWYDGASLLGAAAPAFSANLAFPSPFVFPTGRSCKNFDDFTQACIENWAASLDLLQKDYFHQFFGGMGRMDLAHFAKEAAAFPDRDRGLDQFLARMPGKSVPAAKLDVQPKLINFGVLKVGKDSQVELVLENRGGRLVFGSISTSCPWLAVTDTSEEKLFQFRDQAKVVLHVKGQHLRAGLKPSEGDVFIESNAGTFKLKAIVEVPIVPFADGVLAGSRSPREVAEKAKKHPREAAALFEEGAVAAWYQTNGWVYPVQGPASNGIAAVQQFFEALGLAKAPKVYVTEQFLELKGPPGAKIPRALQVRSDEQRPVYAHAVSNADWLKVNATQVKGNVVTLRLEASVPDQSGHVSQAMLRITSNGMQQFEVPVKITADAGAAAATVVPPFGTNTTKSKSSPDIAKGPPPIKPKATSDFDFASPAAAASTPATSAPFKSASAAFDPIKFVMHLAPLVLLCFVLMGLFAKDVLSDAPKRELVKVNEEPPEEKRGAGGKPAEFKVVIHDEPDEGPVGIPVARFKIDDEPEERFGPAQIAPVKVEIKDEPPEVNPVKGGGKGAPIDPNLRVSYLYGASQRWDLTDTSTRKRLTYSANGSTNTTIVRVNGRSVYIPAGGNFRNLPDDPQRESKRCSAYTFFPQQGLRVTQFLEIVPSQQPVDIGGGQQRRLMNTLLVRYLYENVGKAQVNVGHRLEVDTLIGNNDGVPFTVPGRGFVNTSADFTIPQQVPDFVQALETGNLRNPGTIVHISLKVGGGIEAPSRVTLCHWARNGDLSNIRAPNMGSDSAIIMVWPDQFLAPGKSREMGYAYGLGSVTVADAGGTLAMTLGGNFDIGKSFTITAYVNKPVGGQTLFLELPPGLERVKGEQTQNVPAATVGTTSIVSWEAKVLQTGVFPVKVRSSTGVAQTKTITIARGEAPTGGKLSLDLKGSFEPGKTFTVQGKVNEPVPNQTLTLHLPPGLQRVDGNDTMPVPAPPAGSKDALLEWNVRVIKPGKYPVRVSSSTGVAQTKTITIVQPGRAEGAFSILLGGEFGPGKVFNVTTKVISPVPDQKLTLVLPAGLEHVGGDVTQIARANVQLAWNVKVKQAGKYTVGVKSTTGVTQRKTVMIEPPADQPGRFNFEFVGEIRPGKEIKIVAKVSSPAKGQTLKLMLPKGMELAKGDALQTVPAVAAGGTSPVSWPVRIAQGGRLPVRIESSTGLARTKTITLAEPNSTLFGGN